MSGDNDSNYKEKRGKRDTMIGVWCDKNELDFIDTHRRAAGISRGNYCRKVVLGKLEQSQYQLNSKQEKQVNRKALSPQELDVFKKALKQLRGIGNNLNQVARVANLSKDPSSIKQERLDEIQKAIDLIGKTILEEMS